MLLFDFVIGIVPVSCPDRQTYVCSGAGALFLGGCHDALGRWVYAALYEAVSLFVKVHRDNNM